jgi:hypothetical protein
MLRPFTGMTVLAAIVMLPMSIIVFAHPEAARGMPLRVLGLMSICVDAATLGRVVYGYGFYPIHPPGTATLSRRARRSMPPWPW